VIGFWTNPRRIAILLMIALAFPLVSCGKKGPPQPPNGEHSNYPRPYPDE
jgi:predicted small lipoprotein YifL